MLANTHLPTISWVKWNVSLVNFHPNQNNQKITGTRGKIYIQKPNEERGINK